MDTTSGSCEGVPAGVGSPGMFRQLETWVQTKPRRLAYLAAAAFVWFLLVVFHGLPLRTAAAPLGIVSLSSARTSADSQAIVGSWSEEQRAIAKDNLYLDFGVIPLYSTTLALSCLLMLARHRRGAATPLVTFGPLVAAGQWGAGALDIVENVTLLELLRRGSDPALVQLAFWSAAGKFALVGVGLAYLAAQAALLLRLRR